MNLADDDVSARLQPVPVAFEASELRLAAVLLPLFQRAGRDHLLFTVRRADLRQHAGQIAFPGGMRQGDESPLACAQRETGEEIGIDTAAIRCLGGLGVRRSSSAIAVHALVGRVPEPDPACIDRREVERLLAVPLDLLRDESRWQLRSPPQAAAAPPSPHFETGSDVIWGLSGRFAFDLIVALRGL